MMWKAGYPKGSIRVVTWQESDGFLQDTIIYIIKALSPT